MINKYKNYYFLIGLLLVLLMNISFFGAEYYLNEESYYHMRLAGQNFDSLMDRALEPVIYYSIIEFINPVIFNTILSAIIFILIWNIILKINKDTKINEFFILLTSLIPSTIYLFTRLSPDIVGFLFLSIGLFLSFKNKYASYTFLFITGYFNIFYMIFGFIFLALKEKRKTGFIFLFLSLLIYYFINPFLLNTLIHPQFSFYFTDIGFLLGYSILITILSIHGLYLNWKRSLYNSFLYAFIILGVIFSLFYLELIIVMAIVLCYFASISLSRLYYYKWSHETMKYLSILMIVSSILFLVILYFNMSLEDKSLKIEDLKEIKDLEFGTVLSSLENGFLISYHLNTPVVFDSYSYKFFKEDKEILFYSKDLDEVLDNFLSNNITHIIIDNNMITGGIWDSRRDGLWFLISNTRRFNLIHNNYFRVYEVVY